MRTRMKLMTVGLVLVTAAVAGCSSTTAGSAGAIQDDVVAAPGSDPTASPTSSSCADGGVCVFGDTGPGGGVVFYVASTPFSAPGTACDSSCLYLETAKYDVGGATVWCAGPADVAGYSVDATGTAIGSGYMNTQAMLGTTNTPPATICTSGAAQAASTPLGGLTDWYLPATDELTTLYEAMASNDLTTKYGVVFGTTPPDYWTSTQASDKNYANAYCQNFEMGQFGECDKLTDPQGVHQVRAF